MFWGRHLCYFLANRCPHLFSVLYHKLCPLFFLSFRFFVHIRNTVSRSYSEVPNTGTENPITTEERPDVQMDCGRKVLCFILPVLYLIGIWTTMLLVSECFGFGFEVVIFTVIGLIVNAGSILRYLSIMFLLFVYSYDCFHNVYLKYLSLNKPIFKDVFERVKDDVTEVTKLPSRLQENRGFKSKVITEQGDHEEPDKLSSERSMHWNVNDLVLFVTKYDLHYLPVKLFYAITMIEVAGAPGSVYKSMLHAWRRFGQIVIFLGFLVMAVNIFGSIYKVGSMSQTLATLTGGIFPFILRNFVSSEAKPIELNSITFRRKVDEVIAHYKEDWPISDLPFEIDEDQSGVESLENVDLFIERPESGTRSKKQILINMGWRDKPCMRADQAEDGTSNTDQAKDTTSNTDQAKDTSSNTDQAKDTIRESQV
ncbi:unnamed protein product [Owenia fusiformis]|uniref:Uncharacterized protein n=1 Tax=Owenia fusiformis TaxID=6347 RepID=A0A8S4PWU7_OWEFU|nr:unnamed protein product [Owenia fusiformis]